MPSSRSPIDFGRTGGTALSVFAAFWTAITLILDYGFLAGLPREALSLAFGPVEAVVVRSEIQVADGRRTRVLDYRYRWDGRELESRRFRANPGRSEREDDALDSVRRYPVGARITVYVNPLNPEDAAVRPGFRGSTLYAAMFLTPFNLIMAGFWWGLWSRVSGLRRPDELIEDVALLRERGGGDWALRIDRTPPALAAALTLGALCFLGAFVYGFLYQGRPPLAPIAGGWALALTAAAFAAFRSYRRGRTRVGDWRYRSARRAARAEQPRGDSSCPMGRARFAPRVRTGRRNPVEHGRARATTQVGSGLADRAAQSAGERT